MKGSKVGVYTHSTLIQITKGMKQNDNGEYGETCCMTHKGQPYFTMENNMDGDDGRGFSFGDMLDEASRMLNNALREQLNNHRTGARISDGGTATPYTDKFCKDMTADACNGDPVIGRHAETDRMIEVLCRRKKNNVVLIGEPGVGKSAIVEGLAQRIASGNVTPLLRGKRILMLDMAAMVAGTKYRGEFEERIKGLTNELERNRDIILYIDEIHTIVGAGGAAGSADAANMLKPALANGKLQCIGATTLDEYRKSIEKDAALERRFQKIIIHQNTENETTDILNALKGRYQDYHRVRYTDEAIRACVIQSMRYIADRSLPDKAIDVMDEAGARVSIAATHVSPAYKRLEKELKRTVDEKYAAVEEQNFERAAAMRNKQKALQERLRKEEMSLERDFSAWPEVTEQHVNEVIAKATGIPVKRLDTDETARLRNLAAVLNKRVIGQSKAIETVTKAIQRNSIGLKAQNRPIGTFMFLGPTGVGKTHLAQQIAREVYGTADALIRVDMSEYNESFNMSRLVGAPPGYVGYDEGGQLTEKVRRRPYSVVLFDEIEKAHQNVYNLLLQVLDEGRMTDGNGRLVDFSNTIIIMTSNTGSRQLKDFGNGVGFSAAEKDKNGSVYSQQAESIIRKALSKQFAPEFLNRLDEVIIFNQLASCDIRKIVNAELLLLNQRVADMGYRLSVSEKAKEFIAVKGYDMQYGARPLKRAIQQLVENEICNMIINGQVGVNDIIKVRKTKSSDSLIFEVESRGMPALPAE